ncbi:MAG: tyrosine-type recombinase/integrase, partial [Bacteroides sp.]|nr:tyrosine-type recombinase/integrase [Bacteroides sp.]
VSHHPVSAEAMDACGPVGDGLIFKGLTLSMTTITFKKWVTDAGISKPVTFHCFRHTLAMQLLDKGVLRQLLSSSATSSWAVPCPTSIVRGIT